MGDDVLSPEHAHVLDEAPEVDVPDTERLDVWSDDGGGREGECDRLREELVEAAADGLAALGEAKVVEVRRVGRLEIDVVLHGRLDEDLKEDPAELEPVDGEERRMLEDGV